MGGGGGGGKVGGLAREVRAVLPRVVALAESTKSWGGVGGVKEKEEEVEEVLGRWEEEGL